MFGAGQQKLIDKGQRQAAQGENGQAPSQAESRRAAPMNAGKEALPPEQRKKRNGESQRDKIKNGLEAEKIMNILRDLLLRIDAFEMMEKCQQHQNRSDQKSKEQESPQQRQMAEMRCSRRRAWRGFRPSRASRRGLARGSGGIPVFRSESRSVRKLGEIRLGRRFLRGWSSGFIAALNVRAEARILQR